jgi:hypothetical protein
VGPILLGGERQGRPEGGAVPVEAGDRQGSVSGVDTIEQPEQPSAPGRVRAPHAAVEGRPTLTLTAGDGFLIPPRIRHNATGLGPGTGQMLSTYIVEIGEPISATS